MKLIDFNDWRGGYCCDVPNDLMADNELIKAENCTWDNGLTKRNGINKYSVTAFASTASLQGGGRFYLNSTWYSIIAYDNGASTAFWFAASDSASNIGAFNFTSGAEVIFDYLNEHIIFCNGQNKPGVIYYSAGWGIENLETHDTRTRATDTWYAGQYDESTTTVADQYISDVDDAQDAATSSFTFMNGSASDGFWVASDYTFNKITLNTADLASVGAAFTATCQFYLGSGNWGTCTLTQTPVWTAATGDRTIEFNYPTTWIAGDDDVNTDELANKFIFRTRFIDSSGTFTSENLEVFHSQYLTQIFENERPQWVKVHKNHIFFGFADVINHSPLNQITGWRSGDLFYAAEGGRLIQSMITHGDYLAIIKENAIYGIYGNSFANFYIKKLSNLGTPRGHTAAVVNGVLWFMARDGLRGWSGETELKISKHIKTDIDSYSIASAAAYSYKGYYWITFPSSTVALVFDPDTICRDDAGDYRVSFYKFPGYFVNYMYYCDGAGDNKYFLGLCNGGPPYIARMDYGSSDSIASETYIDMVAQSKRYSFGSFQEDKHFNRVKAKVKNITTTTGYQYYFCMLSDDDTVSCSVTITTPTTTGYTNSDYSIPYTLDGKTISFMMRHYASTTAKLMGYSLEYERRRF